MLKYKSSICILLLMSVFIGCSGKNNPDKQEENVAKTTENKKVNTIKLTKEDFLKKVSNYEESPEEWKYLGDKPALIDFYADWCGPCKVIAPSLEELAEEYKDQIYIYKIDTEQEEELAAVFGIRSIPSLLFIPLNGNPQMARGAMPKADIKSAIEEVLLNKHTPN